MITFLAQQTPPDIQLPVAMYVIWGLTLAVAVFVILPVTIYLLQRTLNASRNIERYFAEMRDAGVGIAKNTGHIKALDSTISVAVGILETATSLNEHAKTIKETLASRAAESTSDNSETKGA